MSQDRSPSDDPPGGQFPSRAVAATAANREIDKSTLADAVRTVQTEAARGVEDLKLRIADTGRRTVVSEFGLTFVEVTALEWYLFAERCNIDALMRRAVREAIARAAREAGAAGAVFQNYLAIPQSAYTNEGQAEVR